MKFNLFNISLLALNQSISFFSLMIRGVDDAGNSRPGLTRHLLFISRDPIGWSFQFLFLIVFSKGYEHRYMQHMLAVREKQMHPNGRGARTGGLKKKEEYVPTPTDKIKLLGDLAPKGGKE